MVRRREFYRQIKSILRGDNRRYHIKCADYKNKRIYNFADCCHLRIAILCFEKAFGQAIQNLNAASKQSKKFDYFYHLAKDGRAAKDIKLYGFSESFIKALAKFLYEIEKFIPNTPTKLLHLTALRRCLILFARLLPMPILFIWLRRAG